jgi:hypothetical protein
MGLVTDLGRPWSRGVVHQILTNEKYIGNNVFNRHSFKLKIRHVANPPEAWIRKDGAFEGIVPQELFFMAQGVIRARSHRFNDEELLEKLRSLFLGRGYLSGILIDETDGMPSSSVYSHRFGSLIRAYSLVGFTPDRDFAYLEINRRLRQLHPEIVQRTEADIIALGAQIERDPATDLLRINDEFSASIIFARCRETAAGARRWRLRLDASLCPDVTVAVRLDHQNEAPLDYYLLPWLDLGGGRFNLADSNGVALDSYRFDSLEMLMSMAERARIRRAA